ncbi:ribosome assembly cofactor RimP [Saccharicrinis sp. FJH54]|uniref:ribosome assembly cofactor RimP n=1 Tax=Saccharicrinis sp. FJH54 TaxID=3344665 RepID=UPI0035D41A16
MITKEQVEDIISEKLDQDDVFIVDLNVTASNKITLHIDSDTGVDIDYCVEVSRLIEGQLDRENDDFDLEVSSAGLSQPFKVFRQYKKNIGKDVTVTPVGGKPLTGVLKSVDDDGIELQTTEKTAVEGRKKKELVTVVHKLSFNEIAKTEVVIKFK